MKNILTIDVEEWFVVEVLRSKFSVEDWPSLTSRVVQNTRSILALLQQKNVHATFFILGWCAERQPDLIREIAAEGHEIGCHSFHHYRVDSLTPEKFREDTKRAIDAITEACGVRPLGYRAPSWSINSSTPWAFEILAELGFQYDSSLFPIKHDIYGAPDAPRYLFRMNLPGGRSLLEIPASTVRKFGKNFPVTGGGYLRHSPYWFSKSMVASLNKEGLPAMVYLHPWEIDPEPPYIPGLGLVTRMRAYGSTDIFGMKLERLLDDFDFTTAASFISESNRNRIGFEK